MSRTLNADLVTAQESAARTPFVNLTFDSFDRVTTRSYSTADSTNRILQVQQAEGRYGSYTLVEGKPFIVSSIIRLHNSDETLNSLDFKGFQVYIDWGYSTSSGNKSSRSGPEFVITQEFVTDQGVNYLELHTINLWEKANALFVNIGNTFPLEYVAGGVNSTKVSYILMELLGGGALDSAQRDDGGSFTIFTTESEDTTTTFGLLPAVPAVDDAFYFGQLLPFDRISIDITQLQGSGSFTLAWEYHTGGTPGTWTALPVMLSASGASANTHIDFTVLGIQIEAFDMPTPGPTWTKVVVNGSASLFFVRARVSAVSSPGGNQLFAKRIFAAQDFAFGLDTSEATQGDDFLPTFVTNVGSQLGPVIEHVLSFTLMGIRLEEDGFHAAFINEVQLTPDQIYDFNDGPHQHFIHTESKQVTIPNRILVVSAPIEGGAATFSGTSNDTSSQDEIGIIPQVVVLADGEITSDANAATAADKIINQLKRDKIQGRVEVPLHCGQEVWDEVRIADDHLGVGFNDGRVSQIVRVYKLGEYLMQIIMGGAIWGIGDVPLLEPLSIQATVTPLPPFVAVPIAQVVPAPDPRRRRMTSTGPLSFRPAGNEPTLDQARQQAFDEAVARGENPIRPLPSGPRFGPAPFIGPRQ